MSFLPTPHTSEEDLLVAHSRHNRGVDPFGYFCLHHLLLRVQTHPEGLGAYHSWKML